MSSAELVQTLNSEWDVKHLSLFSNVYQNFLVLLYDVSLFFFFKLAQKYLNLF